MQKFRLIIFFLITISLCGGGVAYYLRHSHVRPSVVSKEAAISDQEQKGNVRQTEKNNDYGSITSRNLFGTVSEDPGIKIKKTPIENLAPTTLDVVLVGTVFGDNDEKRAIILERGKTVQEMYYIGDSIKGAIVKDILRGKVVLGYNNKDEILAMGEGKGQSPASAAAVPPNSQQEIPSVQSAIPPPSPVADSNVPETRVVPSRGRFSPTRGNK